MNGQSAFKASMTVLILFATSWLLGGAALGDEAAAPANKIPAEWLTKAEQTDFRETDRYHEVIDFCKRLDEASDLIYYRTFGKSSLGRDLPLLIAALDSNFDPRRARASGKPIVLVQNAIHSGECDGKDAAMMLLRDIAITKTRVDLLQNAILMVIPIYNVDGHERFGPHNRINQNGPAEMGWRTTAQNYNLNRDYMKADAPETRAWLSMWNEWQPDLHVDTHTTDGGDWQYDILLAWETSTIAPTSIVRLFEEIIGPNLMQGLTEDGHVPGMYFDLVDSRDPSKGIASGAFEPRFASGYVALRNRPSILVESHMLKPYRTRVMGTYSTLRHVLDLVNRYGGSVREAGLAGDRQATDFGRQYDPDRKLTLAVTTDEKSSTPFSFKGYAHETRESDISGAKWIQYDPATPKVVEIPWFKEHQVTAETAPPVAYVIPPQWTAAIDLVHAHGLRTTRLGDPTTLSVESYRLREPKFAARPFEGRFRVSFTTERIKEDREFPEGSVIVPLDQPAARAAVHLLEPDAPDSLVQWGLFNAIFEQKEYAEGYILEKLAREMLAADPQLKNAFDEKVAKDAEFAKDARARLNFFYQRSPYWDQELGRYPVARLLERKGT